MSLEPGDRLGPYRIEGALGAGGMGEVYRARDTRLHREVAVNVLPAGVGVTAEARSRPSPRSTTGFQELQGRLYWSQPDG